MSDTTPAAGPSHKRQPILPKDVKTGPVKNPVVPQTASKATRRWGASTLAVVFGLLFAYDVWEGIDWLVGGLQFANSIEAPITAIGWVSLALVLLSPALFYLASFLIARRRAFFLQIVIYVAGWAAASCFYFSLVTLFPIVNIVSL